MHFRDHAPEAVENKAPVHRDAQLPRSSTAPLQCLQKLWMGGNAGTAADKFDPRAFINVSIPADLPQERSSKQARHRPADDHGPAVATFCWQAVRQGRMSEQSNDRADLSRWRLPRLATGAATASANLLRPARIPRPQASGRLFARRLCTLAPCRLRVGAMRTLALPLPAHPTGPQWMRAAANGRTWPSARAGSWAVTAARQVSRQSPWP